MLALSTAATAAATTTHTDTTITSQPQHHSGRVLQPTVALVPPTPTATTAACPHGRFYAYYDRLENISQTRVLCQDQAFFCSSEFEQRVLAHPCRARTLSSETPVLVLNPIHRAIHRDHPTSTNFEPLFTYGYESSLRVLRHLPDAIRWHRHVYLLEGGEHWAYRGYEEVAPVSTVWFTSEPMWARLSSRIYDEPEVPSRNEACYLYWPTRNVVAVPYSQRSDETPGELRAALLNEQRPYQLFHYAGAHGMATKLRSRLYTLCDLHLYHRHRLLQMQRLQPQQEQIHWQFSNWSCPTPEKPLDQYESLRILGQTKFCLIPAGDSPGRVVMWDALRRGCVPVLFSSCDQASVLQSHSHLLPPDPGRGFGVRRWSVLLNQTAVMTSPHYLANTLSTITEQQIAHMRAAVRPYIARNTFNELDWRPGQSDAAELVLQHVLQARGGAPLPSPKPALPANYRPYFPEVEYARGV